MFFLFTLHNEEDGKGITLKLSGRELESPKLHSNQGFLHIFKTGANKFRIGKYFFIVVHFCTRASWCPVCNTVANSHVQLILLQHLFYCTCVFFSPISIHHVSVWHSATTILILDIKSRLWQDSVLLLLDSYASRIFDVCNSYRIYLQPDHPEAVLPHRGGPDWSG